MGARQRADRHAGGVSVVVADGAADRFLATRRISRCTRPISRRPAITAAGTRGAPLAASPSRSCRRRSHWRRCRRPSSRSSTPLRPDGAGGDPVQPRRAGRQCRARTARPALYPTRYYLPPPPPPAEPAQIAAAAERILAARTPVIIAGNGVRIAQGYEQLQQLAELAGMPVATTAAGKGTFRRPIHWRWGCSAPSAPPRPMPASAKRIWCWWSARS